MLFRSVDRCHNNGFKRINKNHSQSFSFPFYVALLEELNMSSMIAIIFILNKLLVKYFTRFKQKAIIGHKFLHAKAGDKKQDPWRVGVVCFSLTSTPFLRVGVQYMFGQTVLVGSKKSFQKKHEGPLGVTLYVVQTYIFKSKNCFKIQNDFKCQRKDSFQ